MYQEGQITIFLLAQLIKLLAQLGIGAESGLVLAPKFLHGLGTAVIGRDRRSYYKAH
jgi:hypothetical protein